jgi:hypothetical protein
MSEQVRRETEDEEDTAVRVWADILAGNSVLIKLTKEEMGRFKGLAKLAQDSGIRVDSEFLAGLLLRALEAVEFQSQAKKDAE